MSLQVIVLYCMIHIGVVAGYSFLMSHNLLPWSRISARTNSPIQIYYLKSLTTTRKNAKLNVSLRKGMLRDSCENAQ
jgi:lipopolysaccharide export LptBFGC system permease protein LptF